MEKDAPTLLPAQDGSSPSLRRSPTRMKEGGGQGKQGRAGLFPCAWVWLQQPPTNCLHPPGWLVPAVARLPAGWAHSAPHPGTCRELLGTVYPDEARKVMRHGSL